MEKIHEKLRIMKAACEAEATAMRTLMQDIVEQMEAEGETPEAIEDHLNGVAEQFIGWGEFWLERPPSRKKI